jgi:PAS domain S-box-containing protein
VLVYSYSYQWFPPGSPGTDRWRVVTNGLVFGALSLVMMLSRIQLSEGLYIDARNAPVALIALFEGWPAGVIAALVPATYRIWRGGSGAPAGVVGLLLAAALGSLAHAWVRRRGDVQTRHALVLSLGVFAATFVSFALAGAYGMTLFARTWLPLLASYVVAIAFAARLMTDAVQRARLLSEQARFRAIIDEASDAIRIIDADTLRIIDVNRRDCELSGYSRDELVGRDSRDLWPSDPELRAKRTAAVTEARTHGFARSFGLPYLTRTGGIISVDSTRRIVERDGRRYEVVIFREAAAREAAEAAQQEAIELRAITLLAGATAHEINNPLAVIMGSVDLLARHPALGAQEQKWINHALTAAARVKDIVLRMTHITRVENVPDQEDLPPMLDIRKSSEERP